MDLIYSVALVADTPPAALSPANAQDRDLLVVLAISLFSAAFALLAFDPVLAGAFNAWAL